MIHRCVIGSSHTMQLQGDDDLKAGAKDILTNACALTVKQRLMYDCAHCQCVLCDTLTFGAIVILVANEVDLTDSLSREAERSALCCRPTSVPVTT